MQLEMPGLCSLNFVREFILSQVPESKAFSLLV